MMLFGRKRLFRPGNWQETTAPLKNPWRGLYTIFRLDASQDCIQNIPYWDACPTADETIALLEVNLFAFREGSLPEEALDRIEKFFCHFEHMGLDLIVRFLYDWDGQGIQHEPRSIETILGHIDQLAPLLHRHTDAIFLLQGLLTGSWGEMHCTRFDTDRDLTLLTQAMEQAAGEKTFLALRCPSIWRTVFRSFAPISSKEAYCAAGRSRTGLFNDAILGSETDMGTYGTSSQAQATRLQDKYMRDEELAFQQQLCRYVPNGGEVVNASPMNAFPHAIKTLQRMRITYLNGSYDPEVIDQWRTATVSDRHCVWNGHSGLSYIAAHLGYRYLIQDVQAEQKKEWPGRIMISITIVNNGFAPCYRPVEVSLCLRSGTQITEHPIDADVRQWMPGTPVSLQVMVPLAGQQQVGLKLCSQNGRQIALANTPWDDQLCNLLGGLNP